MGTDVESIASTKENKLGNLSIYKNANSCGLCRLIAFKT